MSKSAICLETNELGTSKCFCWRSWKTYYLLADIKVIPHLTVIKRHRKISNRWTEKRLGRKNCLTHAASFQSAGLTIAVLSSSLSKWSTNQHTEDHAQNRQQFNLIRITFDWKLNRTTKDRSNNSKIIKVNKYYYSRNHRGYLNFRHNAALYSQ